MIKHVIETTHRLTQVMGTPNKLAQALRDTVIPMVSRLAPFQHAFVSGCRSWASPIAEARSSREPGSGIFDDSLRGGKGIVSRFLLMVDEASASEAKQLSESYRDLVEVRSFGSSGMILVRPDGYIAYEAHGRVGTEELASLRDVLDRQTEATKMSAAASN